MAVKVRMFPACCTGVVLVNFGETPTSEYGAHAVDEETLIKEITAHVEYRRVRGEAFVSAVTNNQQRTANRALRACGFKRTQWMKKLVHEETKVAIWHLPLF